MQKLNLSQHEVALRAAAMWRRVLPAFAAELPIDAMLADLASLVDERELQLKRLESALVPAMTDAVRKIAATAGEGAARSFVGRLEEAFQAARGEDLAHTHLVFDPASAAIGPATARIWVAGCGQAWEAAWIQARFPAAASVFLDLADAAVAAARVRLEALGMRQAVAQRVDLTKAEDLPPAAPDLILYVHPYVIEHADYEALHRNPAGPAELSFTGRAIFSGLWQRLAPGGTLFVATLEEVERLVIERFFAGRPVAAQQIFLNPYALKTVSTLLRPGRPVKLLESRSYHHLLVLRK